MASLTVERRAAVEPPPAWLLALPLALLLALLPVYLSALAVAGLAGAALVLARPRWALYFVAFTVPYQSLVDVKVYGASFSVTEAVILLLLVGWITQLAAGRASRPRPSAILLAIGIVLLVFLLSTFVATDLSLSAKELLKWVELAAVYLIGTSLLETPRQRHVMLGWLVGAGVSQALVGLVQSALRVGPPHFMLGGVLMRAYGTFEQPNPFAGYLGLVLPLTVALALFGLRPGPWRRAAFSASAVLGLAMLLSLSRGAWMGQVVALLLVIMTGSRAARHAVLTFGLGGALVVAALWPLLPSELSGRAASVVTSAVDLGSLPQETVTPENWAVLERLSQWYAGWQMFAANPILGVGIGNYNAAYDNYRLDQWPMALGHAHNHYLTIAAEAGFFGLLAYLLFLGVAFRSGVAAYQQSYDRMDKALIVGILGCLAAFATHNMFDVMFVHGMGVTVGLLLALLHGAPGGAEDSTALVDAVTGAAPAR